MTVVSVASACFVVTMSDFLCFVSWLAGWVVSLFSCSVVWCFAYIMTAVVVVSCSSVFGVCCFVYTMTT